ncbi:hypothetical protein GCM10009850_116230 [Nonomuraea monospora]|uniref:Fibronectin type-III domain-containing protein n=1 Tax=Nonomuraea monospora TaxID=568818 RepID=A0ABP5PWQ6_9ACTN
MRLALIAAALTLSIPATPAAAAPLDPSPGLKFDFGSTTSPLADGYTRVAHTTLYTPDLGYGLDRAVGYRDRGTADPVTRDFTVAASYGFAVDVPNGEYELKVISGDAIAPNTTTLAVEGEPRATITASTGAYGDYTGTARITDGRLDLGFGQDGRVNAILVAPATAPTGLAASAIEATATPAVTLTWNATGSSGYEVYRAGTATGPWAKLGDSTAATFTDTTPELGLTYAYAVKTPGGTLGAPLTVTVKDAASPAPATPEGLQLVTATTKKITLRWRPAENALLYHLYRDDERIGVVTDPDKASYTDEIVPGARHAYRVVAAGPGGLSAPSATLTSPVTAYPLRRMPELDRGLVAVPTGQGTLVSWRMLGTDPSGVRFKLYKDGKPLTSTDRTNHLDAGGTGSYTVAPVLDGREGRRSAPARPWTAAYLDIPLEKPTGGVTPAGNAYDYRANDAAAADLDGDGQYEIVLKWDPSNSKDNSQGGYTGPAVFDAYELDGTRLWRVDLGRNVRAGAHYSPFLVDDFDGDGRAEFVVKTADGTVDGAGMVIGDPAADHNTGGRILSGPEYLTVFDGRTGKALATVDYEPARGNLADWGDSSANRSDRFLAASAYLDGSLPSIVMTRGYYAKSMLVAYDWRGGRLTKRWTFSSSGNPGYGGQGNHNLSVADVDADGRDEIAYGAMTLDDDGTGLYTTKLEHGDAMHLGDLDPARPGLEIVGVHEHTNMPCGLEMHDAATGEILWCVRTGQDTGRGLTGDIDPAHPGEEAWASNGAGLHTATGDLISADRTPAISNTIWWDGDLSREILDHDYSADKLAGVPTIGKWTPSTQTTTNLLTATGTYSNNTTKGNPSLQADLLGDWREELLVRTEDSTALRLYATPYATEHRFPTLTHDPVYQSGVTWQNVGYNQPPHTGFFLGTGMTTPPAPYLTTGAPLPTRVQLHHQDQLQVKVSGTRADVLPATVRAVADGKIIPLSAVPLRHDRFRVDATGVEQALSGYTGTVTVTVSGHLSDGRTFTGELKLRP